MEFWSEIGVFTIKTIVLFLFFAGIILIISVLALKAQMKSSLEIEKLNEKMDSYKNSFKSVLMEKSQLKDERKKDKKAKKDKKDSPMDKPRLFVIDFKGDIKASQVENLREEITAILTTASSKDEVLVCVESPGGVVNNYGLAASELARVREHQIPLTVCVDKVAASGGYLMACTAHKILCAPFGIVGSIGVVAQVPNFSRLLKKHDVDYKEYTAGDYKRTVSLFGEITPKGEEKFLQQLEQTHQLFKSFVTKYRPQIDMEKVGTGEYWFGEQCLDLKLIDQIKTSDDYILEAAKAYTVLKVKFEKKQPISEKLSNVLGRSIEVAFEKIIAKMEPLPFFK
ncbi:MAG: protease SohB [Bdellovibrionaceae bacterium]|nr:protease SohB [Pseudobdellovibrionaceae bacterium]